MPKDLKHKILCIWVGIVSFLIAELLSVLFETTLTKIISYALIGVTCGIIHGFIFSDKKHGQEKEEEEGETYVRGHAKSN